MSPNAHRKTREPLHTRGYASPSSPGELPPWLGWGSLNLPVDSSSWGTLSSLSRPRAYLGISHTYESHMGSQVLARTHQAESRPSLNSECSPSVSPQPISLQRDTGIGQACVCQIRLSKCPKVLGPIQSGIPGTLPGHPQVFRI